MSTSGQRVREALSAFLRCAVLNGPFGPVVVMGIAGGVLFWETTTGRCETHFSAREGQQLDLDELRDLPGTLWVLEEKFVEDCINSTAHHIH